MRHVLLFIGFILMAFCFSIDLNALTLKRITVNRDIEYIEINLHTYILISFFDMQGYGRIGTNHLLYVKNNNAFLFDAPNDSQLAEELYQWVKEALRADITAVSVSHWHQDHSGGLAAFHKHGVKSYSYSKTSELMKAAGLEPAQNTYSDFLTIDFEGTKILLAFCGGGHTVDNSIGWIEDEKILFSGSVIRSLADKNLGYLKDADVKAWPQTIENIRKRFGSAVLVIPGHGDAGGTELIEYTATLTKQNK